MTKSQLHERITALEADLAWTQRRAALWEKAAADMLVIMRKPLMMEKSLRRRLKP